MNECDLIYKTKQQTNNTNKNNKQRRHNGNEDANYDSVIYSITTRSCRKSEKYKTLKEYLYSQLPSLLTRYHNDSS